MQPPKIIFIDTCIFDGFCYDFARPELKELAEKFPKGVITALLPQPTSKEIEKHIAERAFQMNKVFKIARDNNPQNGVPFLSRLSFWPDKTKGAELIESVRTQVMSELNFYLDKLGVIRLTHNGISIDQVVQWHDQQIAPFSKSKPKEFPDALALAAILCFSADNNQSIAIISTDGDFGKACERYDNLHYFKSIADYLKALDSEDENIGKITEAFNLHKGNVPMLVPWVRQFFPDLFFTHEEDDNADIDGIVVRAVMLDDFTILHMRDQECTMSLYLNIVYEARVRMVDPDSWTRDSDSGHVIFNHHFSGRVEDSERIKAIITFVFNELTYDVKEISSLAFIDDVVTMTERPGGDNDRWDDNEYAFQDDV